MKLWKTPLSRAVLLTLLGVFETQAPSTSPDALTRSESLVFKAMGLFVIAVGLAILGISCWLAWRKWDLLGPPFAIGVLLTVGGVVVFRWSLPQRAAKPSRD